MIAFEYFRRRLILNELFSGDTMTVKAYPIFIFAMMLLPFSISAQDADDIIIAAKSGKIQDVDAAIKKGADVNVQDETGATATMWASLRGHKEIVLLLIRAKADLNIQSSRGSTALSWAAMRGKRDIVSALLDAGADLTKQDLQGKSPAVLAEENGYHDISVLISGYTAKTAKISAAKKPAVVRDKEPETVSAENPLPEKLPVVPTGIKDYYPAKTGDSWSMKNMISGAVTTYYVLDADAVKASIQCESKKAGKRLDYYRQIMSYSDDAVKVSAFNRDEIVLKVPLTKGAKWFIEKNGSVFEREIVLVGETVSFSGKDYSCIITRDIITVGAAGKKGGGVTSDAERSSLSLLWKRGRVPGYENGCFRKKWRC